MYYIMFIDCVIKVYECILFDTSHVFDTGFFGRSSIFVDHVSTTTNNIVY